MKTKTEYKPKSWYKQLINIAKGQLEIDEVNYRAILQAKTKKNSLTEMSVPELFTVLEHMKTLGFKPKANKRTSPKSKSKKEITMLDKLRQVWKQMHYQGFINNGDDKALQTWAANQSKRLNKGVAVTQLEWLKGNLLYSLIEQLKKWHMRLLGEVLEPRFNQVRELYHQAKLTEEEMIELNRVKDKLFHAPNTHSAAASAYSVYLDVLKQHNVTVIK